MTLRPFAIALISILIPTVSLSAKTADETTPLLIGAETPSVALADQNGKAVELDSLLSGKSSVVIFYRGSWCPYCNTHLQELASIENDLKALGYQILAISPDTPDKLGGTETKHDLGYTLLSDSEFSAMEAFGIAYDHKRRGKLPVPSVFLVTPEKRISFQYVNPNYRYRISANLLMAAAEAGIAAK